MVRRTRWVSALFVGGLSLGAVYGCASLAGVETLDFVEDEAGRIDGRPQPDVLDASMTVDADAAVPFRDPTLVGFFKDGTFYLALENRAGAEAITFAVDAGPDALPFAHHVDAGRDTVGWYEPNTSTFYFLDENRTDAAISSYQFGSAEAGAAYEPLVGDWLGTGTTSLGLYNRDNGAIVITFVRKVGNADQNLSLGVGGAVPFAGDWKRPNDTGARPGIYVPDDGAVFLSYTLDAGSARVMAKVIPARTHAFAGEWGLDPEAGPTIGVYDAKTGEFRLYRDQTPLEDPQSGAVMTFTFGVGGTNAHAIAGRWKLPPK